ncbi:hypothetical protein Poli38472_013691 [Pythium oligandrum]|uniref:ABC transporter domain-containing protein n=1 Tax=Pythium oligandrum TaxID=41045 RepID=A0A8K1FJZ5_PYTOL|nr:hypothetical protein Poli38472_013691 [Pythium oligandrum]|eukprot:TMW61228.1 hypothetical protein Poli38472_013691 [Pythium oligandrum]
MEEEGFVSFSNDQSVVYRYAVVVNHDRLTICLESRTTKTQWRTAHLSIGSFAREGTKIPGATINQYATAFATCLGDGNRERFLSKPGHGQTGRLVLVVPMSWSGFTSRLHYAFELHLVPSDKFDAVIEHIEDLEGELRALKAIVNERSRTDSHLAHAELKSSSIASPGTTLRWTMVNCTKACLHFDGEGVNMKQPGVFLIQVQLLREEPSSLPDIGLQVNAISIHHQAATLFAVKNPDNTKKRLESLLSATQRLKVGDKSQHDVRLWTMSTKSLTLDNAQEPQHFIQIETPKVGGSKYETNAPKLTLQWHNLTLKASVKNPQTKQAEEKVILNDVSGYAKPGELLVIMGPSGAGKSSLLDCISGRKSGVEGSITVNGAPWSKQLKRLTSYVMQDDLFYATITVREHLMFQARLRMGNTHSVKQYTERVDTVMEELGLSKCRDTLIGSGALRGISGGERKRLSFATEILTNPSLLFVDEPTSGLDSFMAETVVLQLQQIARDGRTVVATIHQPSSELFALFDKLLLVADGSIVYHGKASDSVEYFGSLGHQCPPFLNPSDYFMRQLVVMDKATDKAGVERVERLKTEWKKHEGDIVAGNLPHSESSGFFPDSSEDDSSYETSRIGVPGQMLVLTQRNFLRIVRDPIAFRANAFTSLFVALIVGLIYLQLDLNQKGIQNFAGAFFFIVVNQTFSAANPAFLTVPLEIPIIQREYNTGLYRLFAWYISKNLSELPSQVLMPVIFFVPTYFLVGIGGGFDVFIAMQAVIILINSAAVGLGYMVSCLSRRVDIAPIIGVMIILPFMLFGGLLINSDDTPDYFIWIQYISPIKYANEALMKIFWGQIDSISCNSAIENCSALTGKDVLRNYSMESRSAFGNAMILLAINVSFRILGFVALLINFKSKAT